MIQFGGSSATLALAGNPGLGLTFIDTADMALLREASPTAAGEIMGHEMMEAYEQALTGSIDYTSLHNSTSSSFPGPQIDKNLTSLPDERNSAVLSGATTRWTLTRPKDDITIAITYKFGSNVPRDGFTRLPNRKTITNVQVVKKKSNGLFAASLLE